VTSTPPLTPPNRFCNVAVVGAGYVGLPTAVTLASFGHTVTVAENDPTRLARLRAGQPAIQEPDLEPLLRRGIASSTLHFTPSARTAASDADVIFLCVPTPQDLDGSADLRFVQAVIADIAPVLRPGAIVVNKSTVPVGTAHRVADLINRRDVVVVSNPEFLREGSAISDSLHPERIVVGCDYAAPAYVVAGLFAATNAPVLITDTATSELIKYAANAFLATKLSYVNAIAGLCEATGADVGDLVTGLGLDSRIGAKFLNPGPGWGGSCLPKDTSALSVTARASGFEFPLLDAVIATNDAQFDRTASKVLSLLDPATPSRVAVWGLTFKAGTDDRRDSPALEIISRLQASHVTVTSYDPTVDASLAASDLAGITLFNDPYEAAEDADVVVVLTEWSEFARPDWDRLANVMRQKSFVDARNVTDPAQAAAAGFTYLSVGRREVLNPDFLTTTTRSKEEQA